MPIDYCNWDRDETGAVGNGQARGPVGAEFAHAVKGASTAVARKRAGTLGFDASWLHIRAQIGRVLAHSGCSEPARVPPLACCSRCFGCTWIPGHAPRQVTLPRSATAATSLSERHSCAHATADVEPSERSSPASSSVRRLCCKGSLCGASFGVGEGASDNGKGKSSTPMYLSMPEQRQATGWTRSGAAF